MNLKNIPGKLAKADVMQSGRFVCQSMYSLTEKVMRGFNFT